jgi:translation elongation factor EF-1alpha
VATRESAPRHISLAICGNNSCGKSTTIARLIYELGGISQEDMQQLRDVAEKLEKPTSAFAFFMYVFN